MFTQFRFNMKLKITILLAFCILLVSCASLLGVQSSKYISEKIGMSKNEFQKLIERLPKKFALSKHFDDVRDK